jgi:hypothetical protein
MARAQNGKGRGVSEKIVSDSYRESKIPILANQPIKIGKQRDWIRQHEIKWVPYKDAIEFEKKGLAQITYYGTQSVKIAPRMVLKI